MVFLEKSQPQPECLAKELIKAYGDHKCGDVLERLATDFKNKCYICENSNPVTINVEHIISHQNDKVKKFDWNNLFWSCGHCNNIKGTAYDSILNCTISPDNVETAIHYKIDPYPKEKVQLDLLEHSDRGTLTIDFLEKVYNGSTPLKLLESANLRALLLKDIKQFQEHLFQYFKPIPDAQKEYIKNLIISEISKSSPFAAFKRWIIKDREALFREFGEHMD